MTKRKRGCAFEGMFPKNMPRTNFKGLLTDDELRMLEQKGLLPEFKSGGLLVEPREFVQAFESGEMLCVEFAGSPDAFEQYIADVKAGKYELL